MLRNTDPVQGHAANIASKSRPDVVSRWIKCGRKYDVQPKIENVPLYAAAWMSWWTELQPRSRKDLKRSVAASENWDALQKGTVNGFFVVLLALSWWVKAENREDKKMLEFAMKDVFWVLETMILTLSQSADGAEADEPLSKW